MERAPRLRRAESGRRHEQSSAYQGRVSTMNATDPESETRWNGGPTIGDAAKNIARHLERFDAKIEDLAEQVDDTFGTPRCVVVSGSVAAGYATPASDLDMYVIVDEHPPDIPVVSHSLGVLMDIYYIGGEAVTQRATAVKQQDFLAGPAEDPIGRWDDAKETLDELARLAIGLAIVTDEPWEGLRAELRGGLLVDKASSFWTLAAVQHLVASRWLENRRPALSRQLAFDAAVAAMKVVTTRAGFIYCSQKWVPVELRALGRVDLLHQFRSLLRRATDGSEVNFSREVAEFVSDLLGGAADEGAVVEVVYLPGVEARSIGASTVLSRWDLAGAVVHGDAPPLPDELQPIWSGSATEEPPPWVVDLYDYGLVWMGPSHATSK